MRHSEIVPHPRPEALKLVVRLMPAIYNRFAVQISNGPPFAEIDIRSARVTFPNPIADDGTLSMECLFWIVEAVADASTTLRHPICLVLGEDEAVYFEPNGSSRYSRTPPRGGLPLNALMKPPKEPLPASVAITVPNDL